MAGNLLWSVLASFATSCCCCSSPLASHPPPPPPVAPSKQQLTFSAPPACSYLQHDPPCALAAPVLGEAVRECARDHGNGAAGAGAYRGACSHALHARVGSLSVPEHAAVSHACSSGCVQASYAAQPFALLTHASDARDAGQAAWSGQPGYTGSSGFHARRLYSDHRGQGRGRRQLCRPRPTPCLPISQLILRPWQHPSRWARGARRGGRGGCRSASRGASARGRAAGVGACDSVRPAGGGL